jgi:hypothetical protein
MWPLGLLFEINTSLYGVEFLRTSSHLLRVDRQVKKAHEKHTPVPEHRCWDKKCGINF